MSSMQNPTDRRALQRAFGKSVREHWVLFLIEGIVLIVLGFLAIALPQIAGLAATIFLGWLFLIGGIVGLVMTFMGKTQPGFWWSLLSALLSLVAGGLLLWSPLQGILTLTLILVAYFIIDGVASIMMAIGHRRELSGRWGWLLLSGIASLVIAGIVFFGFPGTAAWAVGLLVGIDLLLGGSALAAIALGARKQTA